jgi:hypothetical protein
MAERRTSALRPAIAAVVVACAAFAACGGDGCEDGFCTDESSARLLDVVCEDPEACVVAGDAARTTGITEDTIGFRLGDGAGTLTLRMSEIAAETPSFQSDLDLQVLVAASADGASAELSAHLTWGSCTSCPQDPGPFIGQVAHDYIWVTVATQTFLQGSSEPLPPDAVLVLSGRGIDIADLRTIVTTPQIGCSIAAPVGRSRR